MVVVSFLRNVYKIAKSDYSLLHIRPSVRQHETTRLPREVFLRNLISEFFSKICQENSTFLKIRQE